MWLKAIAFLKSIFVFDERKQIEEYLSKATDIYDLEFRMREISKKNYI